MSEKNPKATAEKLVDNMTVFYDKYEKSSSDLARENIKSGSWISRWFTGTDKLHNSEIHKQFYDAVETRCTLLDGYLAQLTPEEAQPLAARAVAIVLDPVPDSMRNAGGWMRLAAEPLCAPLLKYLSKGEIVALRAKYVDVYPKRRMFDTQKALLREMERLIREKESS